MVLTKIGPGYQFFNSGRFYLVYRVKDEVSGGLELECFRRSKVVCDCVDCVIPGGKDEGYETSGLQVGKDLSIGRYTITTGLAITPPDSS